MRMSEIIKKVEEMKECEVIASKPWSSNPNDSCVMVILCHQHKDTVTPYVVWDLHLYSDGTVMGANNGTYCERFEYAAVAYQKRGCFGIF
jgi:hypothetical protein